MSPGPYVSRAGQKLSHALAEFEVSVRDLVCADFGASTGGFTDCLLQKDAYKVYAVDTAYGEIDWGLRNNPRVVVMERENALHVALPEKVDLVTIDTGWTRLAQVMPNALKYLKDGGRIIALVKPHYETSQDKLVSGKLPAKFAESVLEEVVRDLEKSRLTVSARTLSPLVGAKAGNIEYLILIERPSK